MSGFDLAQYLARVGLPGGTLEPTLETLTAILKAQSSAIAFENVDVVLGQTISMDRADVFSKLVGRRRGGYCFEQNTLLLCALEAIGFSACMALTRVRWGMAAEDRTPYTHAICIVSGTGFVEHLADVGFGCVNSPEPIALGRDDELQPKVDGVYRTTTTAGGTTALEVQDGATRSNFRPLYEWSRARWETAADFGAMNWFSCTCPKACFTQQFLCARIHNGEKMHILNGEYKCRCLTTGAVKETRTVESLEALVELLSSKFLLEVESSEKLGRYL